MQKHYNHKKDIYIYVYTVTLLVWPDVYYTLAVSEKGCTYYQELWHSKPKFSWCHWVKTTVSLMAQISWFFCIACLLIVHIIWIPNSPSHKEGNASQKLNFFCNDLFIFGNILGTCKQTYIHEVKQSISMKVYFMYVLPFHGIVRS